MGLDVVNPSNSKGGTSTDGNSGRRFFSEELVKYLHECVPEKFIKDVLHLHLLLSSILRAVSSQRDIDIENFTENCLEASLLIAERFPWASKYMLTASLVTKMKII